MVYRTFLKLPVKLEGLVGQELRKPNFQKSFHFGKKPKIPVKCFLAFGKKLMHQSVFFYPKNGT